MTNMRDLANCSKNASEAIVAIGQTVHKENLLDCVILSRNAEKHRKRLCHIHDLEFYDITYNCIGVHVQDLVKKTTLSFESMLRALHRGIVKLTNRQSGGIGFINFDTEAASYLRNESDEEIIAAFQEFFMDLNLPTRKGCEKPYVTLNFGLDTSVAGRRIASLLLAAFEKGQEGGKPFMFPNLVFKIKKSVNASVDSPNYDIYRQALSVTANRMIPTYFNCDQTANLNYAAETIGIMGCRTRVATNINGKEGAFNRGNVACVTLNLVQMAYAAKGSIETFYQLLDENLIDARDVLLHRFHLLCNKADFQDVFREGYYLGAEKHDNAAMLKNGTLSIGFIGLWDALQILTGEMFTQGSDLEAHFTEALEIVKHMREFTDQATREHRLNFSLLASAAEGVTGKFAEYDKEHLGKGNIISEKGFYTNSFHVPVDIPVSYRKKIRLEGPFHALCNGGSITYVEFREMPNRNIDAVQDVVDAACQGDCSYIGVNFPMDYCDTCGYIGRMGEKCPACGSTHVKRLRRVSGYLAEEADFATGKKFEMEKRTANMNVFGLY